MEKNNALEMILISAQQSHTRFIWELEVLFNNLKQLNCPYEVKALMAYNGQTSRALDAFYSRHPDKVVPMEDTRSRQHMEYVPSIKLHLVGKYLESNPQRVFLLHDSDIIFREMPDFSAMIDGPEWHLSATDGPVNGQYLGYEYIKTKGEGVLQVMCDAVGIDPEIVKAGQAGGAQWLVKDTDAAFWHKAERQAVDMYTRLCGVEDNWRAEWGHPIQKWTAEMWAILWGAWRDGHPTVIDPELAFCWATDHIDRWHQTKIYHNAGVIGQADLFNKNNHVMQMPWKADFSHVNPERCSIKYCEAIKTTAQWLEQ